MTQSIIWADSPQALDPYIDRFCTKLSERVALPSGLALTKPVRSRRKLRTLRSYAAMTWRLIGPAARIAFNNLAGLAVIVTVGAALWIWSPA